MAQFAPQTGVWECVQDPTGAGRGIVMRQMVVAHPVAWRPDEQRPLSVIGNVAWADTDISIDVALPAAGNAALLGARANPNCCSRVITGAWGRCGRALVVGASQLFLRPVVNACGCVTATVVHTPPHPPHIR